MALTSWSSCLCFLSIGITGVGHHARVGDGSQGFAHTTQALCQLACTSRSLNSYAKKNNLALWLKHHSTMSNFLCNKSKLTSDRGAWVSNITLNLIIFIVSIFGITAWWLGTLIFHYSNELRSPLKLGLFKENSESLKEHFNNSTGDLKLLNCGRDPGGGR